MSTIDVQGDYLVHVGQDLSFADEVGFEFLADPSGAPSTLTNKGSIEASFSAGFDAEAYAIMGTADQGPARFLNHEDASLTVSGASEGHATSGFALFAPGSFARNDGTISVKSPVEAYAGWLFGSRMLNNGTIEADGHDGRGAGLVTTGLDPSIVNHGSIHAMGAEAIGLFLLSHTTVKNTGHILAEGSTDPVAITAAGNGPDVYNSGIIEAVSVSGGYSAGVSFGPGSGSCRLMNSGMIKADTAVLAVQGQVHAENTGEILGKVVFGEGYDVLDNSGLISGEIDFGRGGDRYFGQHDAFGATVYGGGQGDSLYSGAGDDLLYGDGATADVFNDGADLLRGGRGHDSLHGGGGPDTLQGGAGADELTGDAGADVFLFAKISDSAWSAPDLITDLDASDVIDLSRIDADSTRAGHQAFSLVASLDGHGGEAALSYDAVAGLTRLELDVDGDGRADAVIAIAGDATGYTGFLL